MASTVVVNRKKRYEVSYTCSPKEAVVCSFEQFENKNFQTWDYDYSKAKLSEDRKTWSCGDWVAKV